MPFGLWAQMGRRNRVLDGVPVVLRDVAMATNFATQFAITGFVGYNFGCMAASDLLFDSDGRFRGQSIQRRHGRDRVSKGAHWSHLANTTEPSMCGGDAALCQITLTACYYYLRQGGYVFIVVCLLATLRKNFKTDWHEIFREGW